MARSSGVCVNGTVHDDNESAILPSQLCIGMYVHLDIPWMDHPFTFSSFKIKSLEQIELIQSLGLKRLRYAPAKSDSEPLPHSDTAAAAATVPEAPPPPAPHDSPAFQAKRARLERLALHRERVVACERQLLSNAHTLRSMQQNLFARPEQTYKDASLLVESMADSMLMDADIAIHLMADKLGNDEVYHHSLNVTLLSMMLAKEMKAPAHGIRILGMGALFHDIGKVEIPDRILRKTEPLTKPELGLLQTHCASGVEIGKKLNLTSEALQVIAQHHEHVDGTGYPRKLQGAQMSLLARIVAVTNVYDNLCNPTNPAKAMTPHEALSTMYGQQRSHFDSVAMNTFIRCMGIYPPGTVVMLSNGTLAMVVSINSTRPLKPTVMVYDPAVPREEAILADLEQEPDVSISKTMRPQHLSPSALEYLDPRRRMTYYFDTSPGKPGA